MVYRLKNGFFISFLNCYGCRRKNYPLNFWSQKKLKLQMTEPKKNQKSIIICNRTIQKFNHVPPFKKSAIATCHFKKHFYYLIEKYFLLAIYQSNNPLLYFEHWYSSLQKEKKNQIFSIGIQSKLTRFSVGFHSSVANFCDTNIIRN